LPTSTQLNGRAHQLDLKLDTVKAPYAFSFPCPDKSTRYVGPCS
jgi:hypothetical protein